MPTDSYELADSQDLDYNLGATGARVNARKFDSSTQNRICDKVQEVLLAAGWSDAGASNPQATAVFPYGFPTTTVPIVPPLSLPTDPTGQRVLGVQGISFRFYDAFRNLPGATDATNKWVIMGTDNAQSLSNLIASIESNTGWNHTSTTISTAGAYTLLWEHETPGTAYNFDQHDQGGIGSWSGHKYWANAGVIGLGGWKLRSTMESGEWLELWVYAGGAEPRPVTFSFTTSREGAERAVSVGISSSVPYSLIANQFQFALFREASTVGDDFVFASQPYLQHGCEQAALVLGNGSRAALSWPGAIWGRESALVQGAFTQVGPKAFVLRSGAAIETSQGYTMVTSAYIGIPNSTTGDAIVVGKLWDAMVTSKSYTHDDELYHRGKRFICMIRNGPFGSNPGSIWIAYDDE